MALLPTALADSDSSYVFGVGIDANSGVFGGEVSELVVEQRRWEIASKSNHSLYTGQDVRERNSLNTFRVLGG